MSYDRSIEQLDRNEFTGNGKILKLCRFWKSSIANASCHGVLEMCNLPMNDNLAIPLLTMYIKQILTMPLIVEFVKF
jgi:hypothetical protein